MGILNSSFSSETVLLKVEQSPVWELILGIAGYTHSQLRHTFDMDGEWELDSKEMPASLKSFLTEIEETNLWHGLILLQHQFSALSVQEFSKLLTAAAPAEFYEWLLPYHSQQAEAFKKEIAQHPNQTREWEKYAELFNGHEYLESYVFQLYRLSKTKVSTLMIGALTEWESWMLKKGSWQKWLQALAFEQKQDRQLDESDPIAEIKRITGGVNYLPEPSIWSIKLIPQISYRPWTLTIRTADTKLFFYPVKEEHLLEPGLPSKELISGHKALGDETRLKLLFQLHKNPLSLQELSSQFNSSKTTLHHHLSLLKAAKFVQVEKGVYSINLEKLEAFSGQLMKYLEIRP